MTALLFLEEAGKLRQLETGVSDILHQLDAILQDQIQQQTAGISVECDVAFTNGCYEVVLLAVEHQGNWDDAHFAVELDRIHFTEILGALGLAKIDSHPQVDTICVVEQVEEGGC